MHSIIMARTVTTKTERRTKTPRTPVRITCSAGRGRQRQTLALREIKYFQGTTNLLIKRLPFVRLVRQIACEVAARSKGCQPARFTQPSLSALQEAFEAYIVSLCEHSYLLSIHAKRVTPFKSDLSLARRIRGDKPGS